MLPSFHRTDDSFHPFVIDITSASRTRPDVWTHGVRCVVTFAPTGQVFDVHPLHADARRTARLLLDEYYRFRGTRRRCRC